MPLGRQWAAWGMPYYQSMTQERFRQGAYPLECTVLFPLAGGRADDAGVLVVTP